MNYESKNIIASMFIFTALLFYSVSMYCAENPTTKKVIKYFILVGFFFVSIGLIGKSIITHYPNVIELTREFFYGLVNQLT